MYQRQNTRDQLTERNILKIFEKVPKFKGDTNWKTFYGCFQRACIKSDLHINRKADMLTDCPADKAADYFMSLPPQIQGHYTAGFGGDVSKYVRSAG